MNKRRTIAALVVVVGAMIVWGAFEMMAGL